MDWGTRARRIFLVAVFFLPVLLAAGCSDVAALPGRVSRNIGTGEVVAVSGLEGRWTGPVTSSDPACGPARSTGLMTIGRDTFGFDPFQSTTVLHGTVDDAGRLAGEASRRMGAQTTLTMRLDAVASRDADGARRIDGTLVSGACRWTVALRRG
jgi:hypothetical protein